MFRLQPGALREPRERIREMNRLLAHRGPDDEGVWIAPDERVAFGHRRLSIIDLSPGGHQPMLSPSGNVIVFNGEIYNFKELKARFFPSEQFTSASDTEVLLRLWEKLGPGCLTHLEGMFAFAVWDHRKEQLFLARDRAGKKPLYYTLSDGVFAFSSELRALLALPFVKREPDETALYHFLTFNLLPPPFTMFRGISKLPPASCMTVTSDGIRTVEPYWEISFTEEQEQQEDRLAAQLRETLQSSVESRMLSDVPVGAFLSGGVDSSAVVAYMSQFSSTPVRTFSIGFEGEPTYDERRFAASVARQFGTDHYETMVRPSDIAGHLPEIIEAFDEPLADATGIPIWFLSRAAKENGIKVVLTGDGSDELFAGYRGWMNYARYFPLYRFWSAMPVFLRKAMAVGVSGMKHDSPVAELFQRAAKGEEFFWGGAKSFKESSKRQFFSDSFIRRNSDLNSAAVIATYREMYSHCAGAQPDDIAWMCYLGYKFSVPNYYLHRMDRLGMAHSVEIRSPFLSRPMTEFAMSVPSSWKVKNGEPKYILKKALEPVLGKELLYRRKQGFNVPLKEWAGRMMQNEIDHGLRSFCDKHPSFNYTGLKDQADRLRNGDRSVANRMWTVYFLMSWMNRWFS